MSEAITEKELSDALAVMGGIVTPSGVFHVRNSRGVAKLLFQYVKDHREPEYEENTMYVDARGRYYLFFKADPESGWDKPVWNSPGSSMTIPFHAPERPLRKLVPEGG